MRINTGVSTSARWRASLTAGLAAVLLAVSGCTGGGGEPAEETTATASESSVSPTGAAEGPTQDTNDDDGDEGEAASASPSGDDDGAGEGEGDDGEYVPASADGPAKNVPVPTKPPMMAYDNPEGAKAAAAYFWDTVNYMHETGDDSYLVAMTGDECSTCKAFASITNSLYDKEGWSTGTSIRVDTAIVSPNHATGTGWVVNQLISSDGGSDFWPEGGSTESSQSEPLDKYPWEVRLQRGGGESDWLVSLVTTMREQ